MPKTIGGTGASAVRKRVPIRLPGPMMNEVDRIVREHPELNFNRQQFVETSVREKIERVVVLEASKARAPLLSELTVKKQRLQH